MHEENSTEKSKKPHSLKSIWSQKLPNANFKVQFKMVLKRIQHLSELISGSDYYEILEGCRTRVSSLKQIHSKLLGTHIVIKNLDNWSGSI